MLSQQFLVDIDKKAMGVRLRVPRIGFLESGRRKLWSSLEAAAGSLRRRIQLTSRRGKRSKASRCHCSMGCLEGESVVLFIHTTYSTIAGTTRHDLPLQGILPRTKSRSEPTRSVFAGHSSPTTPPTRTCQSCWQREFS